MCLSSHFEFRLSACLTPVWLVKQQQPPVRQHSVLAAAVLHTLMLNCIVPSLFAIAKAL